jgi:hypothetical protein
VDFSEYGSEQSVSIQHIFFVKIISDFFAVIGLFSFMKPGLSIFLFISQNVAICPKTFSNSIDSHC